MKTLNNIEKNELVEGLSDEQFLALRAYLNLIAEKKNVCLEFTYYDSIKVNLFQETSLLSAKKTLVQAGLPLRKLEKHNTPSYQLAKGDIKGIHVCVFPKDDVFIGCKIVEKEIPVEIPAHTVAAQPARNAIPEHVEPAHTEMVKKKIIVCGQGE